MSGTKPDSRLMQWAAVAGIISAAIALLEYSSRKDTKEQSGTVPAVTTTQEQKPEPLVVKPTHKEDVRVPKAQAVDTDALLGRINLRDLFFGAARSGSKEVEWHVSQYNPKFCWDQKEVRYELVLNVPASATEYYFDYLVRFLNERGEVLQSVQGTTAMFQRQQPSTITHAPNMAFQLNAIPMRGDEPVLINGEVWIGERLLGSRSFTVKDCSPPVASTTKEPMALGPKPTEPYEEVEVDVPLPDEPVTKSEQSTQVLERMQRVGDDNKRGSSTPCTNNTGSYCFQNNARMDLHVTVNFPGQSGGFQIRGADKLVVRPGRKECFFDKPIGGFQVNLQEKAGSLWGHGSRVSIRIAPCETGTYVYP